MKQFFNNLKFVWNFAKTSKRMLIRYILFSIMEVIIRVIIPVLSAKIIVYLNNSLFDELIYICLVLFGCNIIMDFLMYKESTLMFKIFTNSFIKMQKCVGREVLKTKNKVIDSKGTGLFIQRITNDTENLSDIFGSIGSYISSITMYLGIFITLFIINKIVFCYIIISMYVINIIESKRAKVFKENNKKRKEKNEKISSMIGEFVRGLKDIKMLNAENSFLSRYDTTIEDFNESIRKYRTINVRYSLKRNLISDLDNFILIILLVFLVKINNIQVVEALIIYNYTKDLPYAISIFGRMKDDINNFNLAAERVRSLIEDDEFEKEKFGDKHLDVVNGNFEFKNVSFAYDKQKVLNDVNFSIKPNETVAFVGKSGTGKTTIFNLLCKMYDNYKGTITIDNCDIKTLDKDTIRGNITIISQNPYIFDMTIKENLELVKENVSMDEIKKACKMACLDEFIESLPLKYDTKIGEGGVNLSGGQRQRLAIARALIQDTEIILFDEATSALDNETQSKITNAINNMKEKYTILIIAHRLSTIINADKILYIEDGTIKDEGNHKELMKTCEGYRKLYESEINKDIENNY